MHIFLDLDGVLRRLTSEPSRFDADCLEQFESAIRRCGDVRIVISSTWRLAMSLRELRSHFSPDVAERIDGVTPDSYSLSTHTRYQEIRTYLMKRGIEHENWLAIDDDPEHYPKGSSLLITDPNKGFDADCALRLQALLRPE